MAQAIRAVEYPPRPDDFLVDVITVNVASLFVDHRYQRGMKRGRVRHLVEHWNWGRYFPIIVVHRGGGNIDRYAVIDGGQRFLAAQELGIKELPAILVVCRSLEAEAELFIGANTTAPVGAGDRFRARIIIGDEEALAIRKTVENYGFVLTCLKSDQEAGIGEYFSIDAVYTIEALHRQHTLGSVLRTIADIWGSRPSKGMTTAPFMMAMHLTLKHMARFGLKSDDLIRRLQDLEVAELMAKGADRYKSMVVSRSLAGGIASVIVDQYNYRNKKPIPPYDRSAARALTGMKGKE